MLDWFCFTWSAFVFFSYWPVAHQNSLRFSHTNLSVSVLSPKGFCALLYPSSCSIKFVRAVFTLIHLSASAHWRAAQAHAYDCYEEEEDDEDDHDPPAALYESPKPQLE